MFNLIKNIAVDRKNSLPVADFHSRYCATGTPVVFGDLTKRWPAVSAWNTDYFAQQISDINVPIYSADQSVNTKHSSKPVMDLSLKEYFKDHIHQNKDFRVSRLPLSSVKMLAEDFNYPRLGLNFNTSLSSFSFGGKGAVEPMIQASDIVQTVHCHFGEPVSLLLIPASQTQYMYKVGRTRSSISSIDFNKPHFEKFPALTKLFGYVAELEHGDAIYIPAGFWYCTAYHGAGVKLSLKVVGGSFSQYTESIKESFLNKLMNPLSISDASLKRKELRVHRELNAKFLKDEPQAPRIK